MTYIVILLLLILFAKAYFLIAKKYDILDIPNHRSAHDKVTIRGIGIIFPLSVTLFYVLNNFQYSFFLIGLLVVSVVSFWDDIKPVANRYRLLLQFMGGALLFYEMGMIAQVNYFLFLLILLIIAVGIVNVFNFMDGINGITGLYSLITLSSLYYVDVYVLDFVNQELIIYAIIGVLVFLYFNFRENAIGFCGDVGSVSIAFIIVFLLSMLITKSGDFRYILLLSIYGIDSVYTILYRLSIKENIFKAHKVHFFQHLVHNRSMSHLQVAMLYGAAQLVINLLLISNSLISMVVVILLILLAIHMERKKYQIALFS